MLTYLLKTVSDELTEPAISSPTVNLCSISASNDQAERLTIASKQECNVDEWRIAGQEKQNCGNSEWFRPNMSHLVWESEEIVVSLQQMSPSGKYRKVH